jgi:hypothetical protein
VQLTPACVTVKVLPAIVSVPVRDEVDVVADALNVTVPLPDPDAPDVMVSQPVLLLAAVHAQPAGALTDTVPVPPPEAILCEVGEIVSVQVMPACVTVNVLPAIVSVPVRVDVEVFALTLKLVVPFAVPDAPPVTVIHDALLTAVHAQPVPAVTVALPVPPPEAIDSVVGEIVGVQGAVKEKVLDGRLVPVPPGPIAAIRASYTTPAVSCPDNSETKSSRILPSTSRAGLPRLIVCTGCVPPETKICML